jgi:hypothetical protein
MPSILNSSSTVPAHSGWHNKQTKKKEYTKGCENLFIKN